MKIHWVKQLSLILDKDMTSFLERFWPLLSKSTTEAVFGLSASEAESSVPFSLLLFRLQWTMMTDVASFWEKRRWGLLAFFRDTKRRIWWSVDSIMQKNLSMEALELKKPTYISYMNVEPSSIPNYSKALRNFLCQRINLLSQKCSVENFQVLLRATKLSKVSSGSQDFWNFFVWSRFMDGSALLRVWTVQKNATKLIEPIYYWLVASKENKKVSNVVYLWN